MALHIAYRGEHPIFFYGQNYMGSLEAYLGAASFQLFGPSVFTLRLGLIVLFVLFLVSMYALTSLLYDRGLALVTLFLLALGAETTLFQQLNAIGGYPETLLLGSLIMLLASWLALTSRLKRASLHRYVLYGCWLLLVAIALWSDPLVLPFILTAGLLLLLFCRTELGKRILWNFLLCTGIGLAGVLMYYILKAPSQSTLAAMGVLLPGQTNLFGQIAQGIAGTVLVTLPIATSGNPLCPLAPSAFWPLSWQSQQVVLQCTIVHGLWGVGYLVLLVVAGALTWRGYRALCITACTTPVERQTAIRHMARLMLLISAALTIAGYMCSPQAAYVPITATRYLVGLLIALPAVISPLWDFAQVTILRAKVAAALRAGMLLLIGGVFLLGTAETLNRISTTQQDNQRYNAVVQYLVKSGATHIYSDYWDCDRMMFESNEQIICSVLNDQLQPGFDRYLPYRAIVQADPHPTYFFPAKSPLVKAFEQRLLASGDQYRRMVVDGYVIYQPIPSSRISRKSWVPLYSPVLARKTSSSCLPRELREFSGGIRCGDSLGKLGRPQGAFIIPRMRLAPALLYCAIVSREWTGGGGAKRVR